MAERDRALLERLEDFLAVDRVFGQRARQTHHQPTAFFTVGSLRAHDRAVIPFAQRFLPPLCAKRLQFDHWSGRLVAYRRVHPSRWGNGPASCRVEG